MIGVYNESQKTYIPWLRYVPQTTFHWNCFIKPEILVALSNPEISWVKISGSTAKNVCGKYPTLLKIGLSFDLHKLLQTSSKSPSWSITSLQ